MNKQKLTCQLVCSELVQKQLKLWGLGGGRKGRVGDKEREGKFNWVKIPC